MLLADQEGNHIVSMCDEETFDQVLHSTEKLSQEYLIEQWKANNRDYNISGTVLFHGYPWMFKTFFSREIIKFLCMAYCGKV